MSDFSPATMFFILSESMDIWLWLFLVIAAVLIVGIVASAMKLRRAGRSAIRPVAAGLIVGLIATIVSIFLVPYWTLAGPDALGAVIDYVFAFLFALAPGAIIGAIVFLVSANMGADLTAKKS